MKAIARRSALRMMLALGAAATFGIGAGRRADALEAGEAAGTTAAAEGTATNSAAAVVESEMEPNQFIIIRRRRFRRFRRVYFVRRRRVRRVYFIRRRPRRYFRVVRVYRRFR